MQNGEVVEVKSNRTMHRRFLDALFILQNNSAFNILRSTYLTFPLFCNKI